MKRLIILVVLASVVSTATLAQRKEASQEQRPEQKTFNEDYSFIDIAQYEGFIPQEPVIYTGDIPVWNLTREETASKESMLKLINQQEKLKRLLPDFNIDFYIRKVEQDGSILYGISAITGSPGAYEITYDITKSTTVPLSATAPTVATSPSSFIKVGVGIRIKAVVITSKPNIEVSNLNQLAIAEANGDLKGGLSFQLFGLVGEEVINMAPNSTAMINRNSIDSFMQSIAILKSRIYDEKTSVVPRIFSVQRNSGDIPLSIVATN